MTSSHLAPGSIDGWKLQDGSVDSSKLTAEAIGSEHLQDEAVTGDKLAPSSVDSSKLALGAVNADHIADEAVTGSKLSVNSVDGSKIIDGAIDTAKLADGSVDSYKLSQGAVTDFHLAAGSIDGTKLQSGAITNEHIADATLTVSKLADSVVRTSSQQRNVLQQFGLEPFVMKIQDETIELALHFEEEYANTDYVLTAMTNHPACYVIVSQKSTSSAVISIIRAKFSPDQQGIVNWMAIGKTN